MKPINCPKCGKLILYDSREGNFPCECGMRLRIVTEEGKVREREPDCRKCPAYYYTSDGTAISSPYDEWRCMAAECPFKKGFKP